jgi:tetratricopeptide (TPR) repeat protein/tRNA A-37 threonylcarbamoyl transferase component Bud32
MNPAEPLLWTRWVEVDRLLSEALDLPAAQRVDHVRRSTSGDDALAEVVLRLLERLDTDAGVEVAPREALILAALSRGDPETGLEDLVPGVEVGRYRIIRRIGRGGMATVYEAERADGAYQQRVALKVLRRGLDTEDLVRRFLTERQILSSLTHPNIGRLLDGGSTATGRPFLVMELVNGERITTWADQHRRDVSARLQLFLSVTDAVQAAHRQLVVHRDIKPSNILVDAEGSVKLLDFGIAKLLEGDEAHTEVGARALTPGYASPEQIRGESITTAADVYQLGVVLYELLTGMAPFPRIGEALPKPVDPRPPSQAVLGGDGASEIGAQRGSTVRALSRRLSGDLDTILRKALEADPADRYGSVEDLAQDIRLHLEGRPIRARPASRSLRTKKWLGRNPWAAPVAVVLCLAALGYLGTLTMSARRLEQERNEAQAQADRAERIKGFLVDLFRSADPFDGSDPATSGAVTVVDALAPAADRIRAELRDDPSMQADLLSAVAAILHNLDRPAEGLPMIEEALGLRERSGQAQAPVFAADLVVLSRIIDFHQPDSAARVLEQAIETLRATVPPDDPRLADALSHLLLLRVRQLSLPDPGPGEAALAIYEKAGPEYRQAAAAVLSTLAQAYRELGRLEDAERAAREALDRRRDGLGRDHPQTAIAGAILGGILDAERRYNEAIPLYRESLRVLEQTAGPDHNQTLATRNNLATTLHLSARYSEAVAIHQEILESLRRREGTDFHRDVAGSLQNLAAVLKDQGSLKEADSLAARAYDVYVRTTPEGHYIRAFPLLTRTEILLKLDDPARAEQMAILAGSILEAALPAGHYALGVARCRRGAALAGQGRHREATPLVRSGLEILRADGRTPPNYLEECDQVSVALDAGAGGAR